ncbi:MAG: HrpE/YscL family type III secretion apparatus protein [Verrucomicrobia bacterium]|nr:HrpE/YscL family type III secretion apparatus protein [Verrucomicrobiota bacterium]
MKYFSLIYGDKIGRTPKGKILPAEEFSALLHGKELIHTIQQEAERYRKEVVEEGEKRKEEAEKRGFEEGLARFNAQIAFLEQEIARAYDEVAKKVLPIALQAAKKIVGREMTLNEATIADIVKNSLRAVAEHKRISIYCNKEDREKIEAHKEQMKELFERLESLVVQDREDVLPGGCIIETEAGIINAQWDNQWNALENAFKQILGSP